MALIWSCWKEGKSLRGIGRLFDRHSSSICGLISRTGGIRPAERVRSKRALSLSEREEISRGIALRLSLRGIAAKLGRAPSTISREVRRNGGLESYRATLAEDTAWANACRPKCCKLASNPKLCKIIGDKLKANCRLAEERIPFEEDKKMTRNTTKETFIFGCSSSFQIRNCISKISQPLFQYINFNSVG